jgi:hypothetical protein
MKKIILCHLFIFSLSISAQEDIQEILCSGTSNDGALIELQVDLYSNQSRIVIEDQAYNLSSNNDFTIAWSNNVEGIRYENFISKINGNMLVIAVNEENSESGIRANLNCVKKNNRVIK